MADGGRIVNMSSILGRAGKVRNTAYCASKHGIIGMTKALALDLAPRRITVNAILPAWIDTPMLQGELAAQARIAGITHEQILRNAKKKLPCGASFRATKWRPWFVIWRARRRVVSRRKA